MDTGAELALRMSRVVHARTFAPTGFVDWFLVPAFRKASWTEARELLAVAPKPLLVSPLPDPGFLGIWPLANLPEADRVGMRHQLANQVSYFRAKLSGLAVPDDGMVVFQDEEGEVALPVAAFLSWCGEDVVFAGTTVERGPDSRVARLVVRRPGPRIEAHATETRAP